MRVSEQRNMRSWKLYWHYSTLTCGKSQLSQGDHPSPKAKVMARLRWFPGFVLQESNDRKSHFNESTPDVEHEIWLHISNFLKITLKNLCQRFHPSYPLPFLGIFSRRKLPQNDPTKCLRSRSLSPPSSELEVGELEERKGHKSSMWMHGMYVKHACLENLGKYHDFRQPAGWFLG